jgi:hypothetical protein
VRNATDPYIHRGTTFERIFVFAKGTSPGLIRKEDLLNALMSYEGKWDMSRAVDTVRAAGLATRVIDYHRF